jgi:transglutaminase-like putative cysteine protease
VRFQVTHKLTTYLLMLAALGTLAPSGLLSPVAIALTIGFAVVSWFVDPGTRLGGWTGHIKPFARLGATAFFALSAYEVWRHLPEPDLAPVLNLALFLIVYKLFGRAANRDYLQIYVLTFLMVLVGAAFAQSFLFAASFAAYVVLTTWSLILLHLRREMEENYLIKHSGNAPSHKVGVARILNSRRVVGGPFLMATGAVAVVVCAGAVMTFALVPRVGAGFALGANLARKNLIGFSDEVTLGAAGFLSADNDTVALRAVLPRLARLTSDRAREAELDHFYWRGTVYETYQQGRWLRAHSEALRSQLVEMSGPLLVREPHTRPKRDNPTSLDGTDRQEIDIVGVSAPVAFALDRPVAFEINPPRFGTLADLRLVPRWSGEVAFQNAITDERLPGSPGDLRTFSGAHYVAYSRDPITTMAVANGRPLSEIPLEIMAPYLALSQELSGRVSALAHQITAGKPTAAAKVVAVMDWLARTHEYSLDVGRGGGASDPVEDFLFDRKAGHCEYFASAAAVLLRNVGVPTRYVNGFLGGEWNAVGQYVTVRQNRAHAWVEAYLGELGWMRVDATPAVRPPGRMGKFRQLLDSVEFFWARWVVGYDLGRQLDLMQDLGRGIGITPAGPGSSGNGPMPWRRLGTWAIAVATFVIVWLALRRRRLTNTTGAVFSGIGHQPVGRLYRRCLERLAQQGYPRRPSETPRELAARILGIALEGAVPFGRLTELYLQARFGRKEINDAAVAELSRSLVGLGQSRRTRTMSHAA